MIQAKIDLKRKAGTGHFSILVADDNPFTRHLLNVSLKRHHYTVYEAKNGYQAIELLQVQKPDLIILDLVMPEMSGAQVCGWIRQRGMAVAILVVTS